MKEKTPSALSVLSIIPYQSLRALHCRCYAPGPGTELSYIEIGRLHPEAF